MDSKNEEISSIFERFRQYLTKNETKLLINEFNNYRTTWSPNKFRMFLTNVLVVMRTWADSQQYTTKINQTEDWDAEEVSTTTTTTTTHAPIIDKMKQSGHYLFLAIVDYLQCAVTMPEQIDRMSSEVEFDMWKRIVTNKWTMNEKFYIHLYNEHVRLPTRLTRSLHNDMYNFYVTTEKWTSATKLLLIELGFVYLLIHDNFFLGCNHILTANTIFTLQDYLELTKHSPKDSASYQRKLITSMNTPEKMKTFLDYYPDVDLSNLISGHPDLNQQRTPLTILDRLLRMDPFYYETIDHVPLINQPDFTSTHPSNRAANMLHLFQNLISRDAKFSIHLDSAHYQNLRIPFYVTTLGFYLLSVLCFRTSFVIASPDAPDDSDTDDIQNSFIITNIRSQQNISPIYLDSVNKNYIYYLVKRASTFSPSFRSFFFRHLNVCCPLLHKPEFVNHVKSIANVRLRSLYDEILDKRSLLTLKDRCRLLIKESVRNYPFDIQSLSQLPSTLQYYLSFDIFNPNFVQLTLEKLNAANGRIKPTFFDELQFHEHGLDHINGHNEWEDQVPDDMDYENEDDHDDRDYDDADADLFDEEGLYSDNDDDDDDEW